MPYQADVAMRHYPVMNIAMIILISLTSVAVLIMGGEVDSSYFVLSGWNPLGIVGHMFLHAGVLHLFGNMLFLWTFGNAVCGKIGNFPYLMVFLLVGVMAAVTHNVFDGSPMIGASGAVNGIVGLFLVYFPRNEIRCFWWLFFRVGSFDVSSIFIIIIWFCFDIWGAVSGAGAVAYWAHIGGFLTGIGVGMMSLHFNWVQMRDTEYSLLDMIAGR